MKMKMLTMVKKCDECPYEWEIEWDGVTSPVANGHLPWDGDSLGWVWIFHHGNNDCISPLIIERSEFDNK